MMKKNSSRALTALLALAMVASLTACGGSNSSSSGSTAPSAPSASAQPTPAPSATPEALAKKFEDAITNARDDEMNKYNTIITNANKDALVAGYLADAKANSYELTPEDAARKYDDDLKMIATILGLKLEDAETYAISVSMMNVKAYGIAVVKPAKDKGAEVETALKGYVTSQQKAFESYLVDQSEIAKAAIVKTLEDGTVVMVMSENAETVYEAIVANLK